MASMSQLTMAMVTLYSGDPKRIQHFMKVYAFAKMIAEEEQLGAKQREIVEAAALVHDIGIHAAEKNRYIRKLFTVREIVTEFTWKLQCSIMILLTIPRLVLLTTSLRRKVEHILPVFEMR